MPPQDLKLVLMEYLEHKDLGQEVSEPIVLCGQALTALSIVFMSTAFNTQACDFCLRDKSFKQCGCTS
jgi:hypothetical protein